MSGFISSPYLAPTVSEFGGSALISGDTDAFGIDFSYAPDVSLQMRVKDTVTPANAFQGDPASKLTYSSPSVKITRRASGVWTATNGSTELPYEWDGSGNPLGLLVEEARTNVVLRSTAFDHADWVGLTALTITADATTGPDGTASGDSGVETVANSAHQIFQFGFTLTALAYYTWSGFVKPFGRTICWLDAFEANVSHKTWFDLSAVTALTNAAGNIARIIDAGNGWRRISLTRRATTQGSAQGAWLIGTASADNVSSFTGDNTKGVYLWGAQLERGIYPSSPIATAGTSVTRAADQISLATSAMPYSATVGTLYVKFRPIDVGNTDNGVTQAVVVLDNATANERFALGSQISEGLFSVIDGGVIQTGGIPMFAGTISSANDHKIAASWAANNFALSANGRPAVINTSGTLPTPTTLRLGAAVSSTLPLNGYIAHIAYFKRTFGTTELGTKTSSGGSSPTLFADTVGTVSVTGATVPLYGSVREAAVYDSSQGKTIFAWEGWDGTARKAYVTSYDHSAGAFSAIYDTEMTTLPNDDHGVPAIVKDHQGYWHAFGGCHGTNDLKHQSTNATNDISSWSSQTAIGSGGSYAYPKPCLVGSTLYVFSRETTTTCRLQLNQTTSLSGGAATWSAAQLIVTFDGGSPDSRVYAGNFVVVGSEIWFVACYADLGDTYRQNVYFFRYDTTSGGVKNYDGSTTVSSGSLPVTLTQADTSFRAYQHGGTDKGIDIPVFVLDGSNIPYIFFGVGPNAGPFDIKMAYWNGSSWTVEDTGVDATNRYDVITPVRQSGGNIDLYYPSVAGTEVYAPAALPIGGNLAKVTRTGAATWGSSTTILTPVRRSIGRSVPVLNGHANAQIFITEVGADNTDASAGGLRLFAYGDSGFLAR